MNIWHVRTHDVFSHEEFTLWSFKVYSRHFNVIKLFDYLTKTSGAVSMSFLFFLAFLGSANNSFCLLGSCIWLFHVSVQLLLRENVQIRDVYHCKTTGAYHGKSIQSWQIDCSHAQEWTVDIGKIINLFWVLWSTCERLEKVTLKYLKLNIKTFKTLWFMRGVGCSLYTHSHPLITSIDSAKQFTYTLYLHGLT